MYIYIIIIRMYINLLTYFLIIFSIILIVIFLIKPSSNFTTVLPLLPSQNLSLQNLSSWKKEDILSLYNNSTSFDNEGLPNGGLLVSLISNSYASGVTIDLDIPNADYPKQGKQCYNENDLNVPNLINLNKLLQDTAKENNTTCFALDTTYISFDSPGILFGPLMGSSYTETGQVLNMSIGFILDVNKIKKYIGCMQIADIGSVGRINTVKNNIYLQTKDLENYNELIRSNKGKGLGDCGCGLMINAQYGNGRGGIFNDPPYREKFNNNENINYYPKARSTCNDTYQNQIIYNNYDYCKDNPYSDFMIKPYIGTEQGSEYYPVGVLIDKDYDLIHNKFKNVNASTSPNSWFNEFRIDGNPININFNGINSNLNMFHQTSYGFNAQPYTRTSFKYFINNIKKKYKSIFKVYGDKNLGAFFTNSYYNVLYNLDAYKTGNPVGNFYYENEVDIYIPNKFGTTKDITGDEKCNVSDDFNEIWKKAVIGIFTNHRCAEDITGSSIHISNRPLKKGSQNIKNDFNDKMQTAINNNNIKYLGKPECNTSELDKCCCSNNNYEILDKIVIKLVEKWNKNNPNNPKINGYIMNDDMKLDSYVPNDFNTKNITKPLKIKQITNY